MISGSQSASHNEEFWHRKKWGKGLCRKKPIQNCEWQNYSITKLQENKIARHISKELTWKFVTVKKNQNCSIAAVKNFYSSRVLMKWFTSVSRNSETWETDSRSAKHLVCFASLLFCKVSITKRFKTTKERNRDTFCETKKCFAKRWNVLQAHFTDKVKSINGTLAWNFLPLFGKYPN